jgi:hypothetical protein
MRIALAVLMALHGVAHMVGFAGSWQLAATNEIPYKTTVLGGSLDLGDAGIRIVGLLWALAAVGFVTVSGATVLDKPWWPAAALGVTLSSMALTLLELPQAKIGLFVNLALIATLLFARRMGLV